MGKKLRSYSTLENSNIENKIFLCQYRGMHSLKFNCITKGAQVRLACISTQMQFATNNSTGSSVVVIQFNPLLNRSERTVVTPFCRGLNCGRIAVAKQLSIYSVVTQ